MDEPTDFTGPGPLTIVLNRHIELVQQYRAVKAIPPVIKELQKSPTDYRMFQETLNNHYKMLLGRSRNFYDNEMSCFDTAFMEMMLDAKTHPGALSIYVEEIIGLKPLSQPQKPEVLRSALKWQPKSPLFARHPFCALSLVPWARPPAMRQKMDVPL
ncbi:MAG: hypothetical protein Q9174_006075 [Haloplaca sp. 1 TL-2023]